MVNKRTYVFVYHYRVYMVSFIGLCYLFINFISKNYIKSCLLKTYRQATDPRKYIYYIHFLSVFNLYANW